MHKMEILLIPTSSGLMKIYVYGFQDGSAGKVYATLNQRVTTSKGYNKKLAIIRAVERLQQLFMNKC